MKTFPRDTLRRLEWLIKMRTANWIPTNYSCLCEVSFKKYNAMVGGVWFHYPLFYQFYCYLFL
nr:unnamed protein product [Callosobruchus chinensis]